MKAESRFGMTRRLACAAALGLASLIASAIGLASTAAAATEWSWSSSDQYGRWRDSSGADISNSVYSVSALQQTIYANSHCDWMVKSNLKAEQYIGSFPHASIRIGKPVNDVANGTQPLMAVFDVTTDRSAVFDHTFKLWAAGDLYEVAIWNDWGGRLQPIASQYDSDGAVPTWRNVTIGGQVYNVYTGRGEIGPNCISFLPTSGTPITKATIDLSAILKWIGAQTLNGQPYWANPILSSVDLGWEICDTHAREMTFTNHDFEVYQGERQWWGDPRIVVNPEVQNLVPGGSADFGAYVFNMLPCIECAEVTWSVVEAGGGSINALGHYVAPFTEGVYHVRATSVLDPTMWGTATITVASLPPVIVTVAPATQHVLTGGAATFTATVNNTANTAVTWVVVEAGGGSINSAGVYTAPDAQGNYHVRATSVADPTKWATGVAAVTIIPPPPNLYICTGGPTTGIFVADRYFSGGTAAPSATAAIDTSLLTTFVPQGVLQSERYGSMSYIIPGRISGRPYTVVLYFAETYWDGAGSRLFNVAINGAPVLSNFDIFAAAGGKNKAVEKSFTAIADASGKISITFSNGTANMPRIDGIAITAAIVPNTPPTISAIPNQTILVNTATVAIPFTIGDMESPAADLTVHGNELLPVVGFAPSQVTFGGSGADRTVTYTPAPNQTGQFIVHVEVSDPEGAITSTQFNVTVTSPRRDVMLDRNSDGISDVWAALYPNAGGPAADPDGDGATNLAEARAGTDPFSALSHFAATTALDASGDLIVRWFGVAGKHYLLESSSDLIAWKPLATDYSGNGTEIGVNVRRAGTIDSDPRAFWRVVAFDVDSFGGGLNDWERTHLDMVATITASAGAHGSISPAGSLPVAKGDSLAFAIAPDSGYIVDQVLVDGKSVGPVNAYTFENIAVGSHTITASFKVAPFTVTPSAITLAYTGLDASFDVYVVCAGDWVASCDQSWLSVSPARGTGNGYIAVTAATNTSLGYRSGSVKVMNSSGASLAVRISQDHNPDWAWISSEQFGTWKDYFGATISCNVWGAIPGWQQTIYANCYWDWMVKANLKAEQYIGSFPCASIKIGKPVNDMANATQPLMAVFDVTSDRTGVFDHTFDIWADGEQYEVMIWNDWNGGIKPIAEQYDGSGPLPTWRNVIINGQTYNVYTGKGGSGPNCISFLPTSGLPVTRTTLNLSEFFKWISAQTFKGQPYWSNPTLTSVQLGWEICDTYGHEMIFKVNDFEVYQGMRSPRPGLIELPGLPQP